ncbi:hypothetical protein ATEIFO6365_0014029500 [Aspergillus terreus]|uniref:N-acetylgalactosaminide beta-1,3-galactosyltransferase n=1 Tax=Aspergillus terreus TaxID=33178 RepID=A0A5M3Z3F3_ASPTE|nr:hypothetical protein ATETN484_0008053500 [Aspergillus terreus]GFF21363.1 hypothetical protein ATEIFO6365_0014029500 [Aspergillus terreus]
MNVFHIESHPSRRRIPWIGPLLGLILICLFYSQSKPPHSPTLGAPVRATKDPLRECPEYEGLKDVLVVLKTGVTEAREKVPIHLQTTLRCVPNYVLLSDFEEDIGGVHVYDVLRGLPEHVRRTHPDFDIYNRVREGGRQALTKEDLTQDVNTAFGKPNNPGWKLDKWKFLPMIDAAIRVQSEAKWYVFMEADTYFVWPNLLGWLSKFDWRKPHYLGNQMQISDVLFAHGGSGFILSQPAIRRAWNLMQSDINKWMEVNDAHWAGDSVLGKLLSEAGVDLLWSWPMLQNAHPAEFDPFTEGYFKKPWCYAPVAYHHMVPEQIAELWKFDRRWFHDGNKILTYRDVFRHVVRPRLNLVQNDWDNNLDESNSRSSLSTVECRKHCVNDPACLQYTFDSGRCWTSQGAKLGVKKHGVTSGWIETRIDAMMERLGHCRQPNWVI